MKKTLLFLIVLFNLKTASAQDVDINYLHQSKLSSLFRFLTTQDSFAHTATDSMLKVREIKKSDLKFSNPSYQVSVFDSNTATTYLVELYRLDKGPIFCISDGEVNMIIKIAIDGTLQTSPLKFTYDKLAIFLRITEAEKQANYVLRLLDRKLNFVSWAQR